MKVSQMKAAKEIEEKAELLKQQMEEHKARELEAQRKLEAEQAKQNNLAKEKENL